MRITLVHNPKAGSASLSKKQLIGALTAAGHQVFSRSKAQPSAILAAAAGSDLILVAGGDGTVAKIAGSLAGRDVHIAVLPLGTANNIAASLRISRGDADLPALVRRWSTGARRPARRPFDLGRATAQGREDFFLESAGGGLFADLLADSLARERSGREPRFAAPDDAIAHALARLRKVLRRAEAQDWRVELDGVDHSGRYLLVEAMNIRSIGPNLRLAPNARIGDGLLDVVLLDEARRRCFDDYLRRRLSGSANDTPGLPVRRARKVTITPRGKQFVHLDDRLWPPARGPKRSPTPVQLNLERHALTFLAPTTSR